MRTTPMGHLAPRTGTLCVDPKCLTGLKIHGLYRRRTNPDPPPCCQLERCPTTQTRLAAVETATRRWRWGEASRVMGFPGRGR